MTAILNLYAGLGGNRKLWEDVEVTAVENDPKIAAVYEKMYPEDYVFVEDAHAFLLDTFDISEFVWSSPPCQSHSKMVLGLLELILSTLIWVCMRKLSFYRLISKEVG